MLDSFDPQIEWLDEVDSTSSELLRRAPSWKGGVLWVAARNQLAGRGRRGRLWVSDYGNLHASVLFSSRVESNLVGQVAFLAGLAVFDALLAVIPDGKPRLSLKWPNDLLLDRKKLGGILVEICRNAEEELCFVVGIGVNCSVMPEDVSCSAVSLRCAGFDVSAERLLAALVLSFSRLSDEWGEGRGFSSIRERWLENATALFGEEVTVRLPAQTLVGLSRGIDKDGYFLLQLENGEVQHIGAGDVFLV